MADEADRAWRLWSPVMTDEGEGLTGDPLEPYRLLDAAGSAVAPVASYFGELAACGPFMRMRWESLLHWLPLSV